MILEKNDLRDTVMGMVNDELKAIVDAHASDEATEDWDLTGLVNEARLIVPLPRDFNAEKWKKGTRDEMLQELQAMAAARYDAGLKEFGQVLLTQMKLSNVTLAAMRESRDPFMRNVYTWARIHLGEALTPDLEALSLNDIPADYSEAINNAFTDGVRLTRDRLILIQTVDQFWVRHLTDLDELREGIGLRAYAQRDPLVSFRTEASNMYADMLDAVRRQVAQRIFNIQFNVPQQTQRQQRQAAQQLQRAAASRPQNLRASGGSAASATKTAPVKVPAGQKVGRNDVCPWCDSGKKVKHCGCDGARKFRGDM
jgi:preprotein translocase subunit SecA